MNIHLGGFTLFAILAAAAGTAPGFAQIVEPIVVTTDKQSYGAGETIIISGEVRDLLSGVPVTVKVLAPNGNLVTVQQIDVGSDKKYMTEVTAGGQMKFAGTYTIEVQYGTQARTSETTFEFTAGEVMMPKEPSGPTAMVENTDFSVGYSMAGGTLMGITADVEAMSLIISIDATDDGEVTLTLPRALIDSKINGADDDFFVLVDGEEVDFDEAATSTDRTLTIQFSAGSEEIEIIGTSIVPEFGTIAAVILAVAIVSIIALSARTRLRITPTVR
ncbi:MAG: PEFG-CTERM sorting domain-containing protein [Nitrosopumilaceae archaeon]